MNGIPYSVIDTAENLLIAIASFVIGYFLARIARLITIRLFERFKLALTLGPSIPLLVGNAVYFLILALAALIGLVALGVPAQLLVLVLAGIGLITTLALQQSTANFAATVIFLVFQPFKRGELIETMGHIGKVQEILLFSTVLQMPDHRLVVLPNSKIQDNGIVNYTRMGRIRADVNLMVRYDQDLERVRTVIAEVASQDARILADPPVEIHIDDLSEKGIRLSVRPSVAPEHATVVRNDLRAQINSRFQAEGIKFVGV